MSKKITFSEWVERVEQTGRKKPEIADDLGIKVASLYRYLSNERVPDRAVMSRILERSGGIVDASCFFGARRERSL